MVEERIWRPLALWVVEWAEPIAIITEAEAGSPKAQAMQAVARKALAGDPAAQATVNDWAMEIGRKVAEIEDFGRQLAEADLPLPRMVEILRARFKVSAREAVRAARRIKRDRLPRGGGDVVKMEAKR